MKNAIKFNNIIMFIELTKKLFLIHFFKFIIIYFLIFLISCKQNF